MTRLSKAAYLEMAEPGSSPVLPGSGPGNGRFTGCPEMQPLGGACPPGALSQLAKAVSTPVPGFDDQRMHLILPSRDIY